MLRNILTAPVPSLAARHSRQLFDAVTAKADLRSQDISQWIWHAGGRDVLGALRAEFGFSNGELDHSAAVLRDCGNLSSASVFHVLERALTDAPPDGWWWMCSFGAGFSCHGALLQG
jgi:alkylresorcinol/alkylpyrone synthase